MIPTDALVSSSEISTKYDYLKSEVEKVYDNLAQFKKELQSEMVADISHEISRKVQG